MPKPRSHREAKKRRDVINSNNDNTESRDSDSSSSIMGGDCKDVDCDDRPEILAAMLIAAVCVDVKPMFAPLYDSVYAAVRRAGDRRAYADALRAAVARALAEDARDDERALIEQSRAVRMLAEVLSPARCALGLGPEAFATLLASHQP
jgi:hypothetical protein